MRKKLQLTSLILLFLPLTTWAQWSVGLLAGADYNIHSQDTHYMTDYRFRGTAGVNVGFSGQYTVNDWLSFRADPTFIQKNYQHTRNVLTQMDYHYRNSYLMLPLLASFHFGGYTVHGIVNAGVYGGYWLASSRYGTDQNAMTNQDFEFAERITFNGERDNRLDLGLAAGLGMEFCLSPRWTAQVEARCYYSLASQVKQYMRVRDYRYDTTLGLQAVLYYSF